MLRNSNINKILLIICLISLALNIWLIGVVLGNKADEFRHEHKGKESKFERKVQMLIQDLPPATQQQFMATMRKYVPDESDFSKKLEDLNYKLAESIKGENVDSEAVQ